MSHSPGKPPQGLGPSGGASSGAAEPAERSGAASHGAARDREIPAGEGSAGTGEAASAPPLSSAPATRRGLRAGPDLPRLVPWVGLLPEASKGSWRRAPGPDQMRAGARSLLLRQAQAWQGQLAGSPWACPYQQAADFTQDQRGAPIGLQGWHWSVSHSSGWCAALLAPMAALGLDVELAARRLSPTVMTRLRPLLGPGAEPQAPQEWLELWVRLEAGLKLSGEGLGLLAKIAADAPDARGRQRLHWPGGTALTSAVRVGPLVIAAAALDDFELEPWSAPVAWLQPPPPEPDS